MPTDKPSSSKSSARRPRQSDGGQNATKSTNPTAGFQAAKEALVRNFRSALDDFSSNPKVRRTCQTTEDLAKRFYGQTEKFFKESMESSSKNLAQARKAGQGAAKRFLKSTIQALERMDKNIGPEDTPKKRPPRKRAKKAAKKTAKKQAAKKSTKAPAKKVKRAK